jgi:hypothetical protein
MFPSAYPHKIVLLTTGFQEPARRLLFARARLYFDRIELTGWHLGERYLMVIALEDLTQIAWNLNAPTGKANVMFHQADGTTIALALREARLWQHTLEQMRRWGAAPATLPAARPLPDVPLHELVHYATRMG